LRWLDIDRKGVKNLIEEPEVRGTRVDGGLRPSKWQE